MKERQEAGTFLKSGSSAKRFKVIRIVCWAAPALLLTFAIANCASSKANAGPICDQSSLQNQSLFVGDDAVPVTVVFGGSDTSSAVSLTSRFEVATAAIKPKVLMLSGEIKVLTFDKATESEQIALQARQPGMLVVIDSEFMKDGKPKYNDLLLSYKNTTIASDQILILDPWPIDKASAKSRPERVFVQVAETISPEALPYILELAAYLWYDPSLFSVPEFAGYASRVTDEAADGNDLTPQTLSERERIISNCLSNQL